MGSIVHKALELLAHRRVCEQGGLAGFREDEVGRQFWAEDMGLETAVGIAWHHYTHKNDSGHQWTDAEYENCLRWTRDVIEFNGGCFNPLNRDIVCPEQYFDLTIDEPWARYEYVDPFSGKSLVGRLSIKGSIDLITRVAPGVIEYLDWKSGARKCWVKNKPKEYGDLCDDPQLLLYFYALSRLYPDYRSTLVTIFFAQDRMPFTIPFNRETDVPRALDMLRKRFETIRKDGLPHRIMDEPARKWWCGRICHYGRTKYKDTKDSVCDAVHKDVVNLGLERAMVKHGRPNFFSSYGSGGGVTNRDTGGMK
jgi:hypothetical protein